MSYGKNKCNLLKELRQKVAQAFNLAYIPEQCEHEGNCIGTCPKCDEELAQMQDMLSKMGVKDFTLDWDAMAKWEDMKPNSTAGKEDNEVESNDDIDMLPGCCTDLIVAEDDDTAFEDDDEDFDDDDELMGWRTSTIRSTAHLYRDDEK